MMKSRWRTWWTCLLGGWLCFPAPAFAAPGMNYTLVVNITPHSTDTLNAFDSRIWAAEPWGNTAALSWSEFHGRKCLRVGFTSSGGTEAYLRTDHFFSPEDWAGVTQVKIDVYVENGKTNLGVRADLKDIDDATRQTLATTAPIPAGTWTTVIMDASPSGFQVAKLFLIWTNLATGDSFCISNLRLVRGGEEMWDSFQDPSYAWVGRENYAFWKWDERRNEPITHKVTNSGAGALIFPWVDNVQPGRDAKLEASDLRFINFANVRKFRVRIRSDRTDAPVFLGFWDGSHWVETSRQMAPAANTWVTLEWDRPSGTFDWEHPTSFCFLVQTSVGGTGLIYLDDLEFIP